MASVKSFDKRMDCKMILEMEIFGKMEDSSSSYRIFSKRSIQEFYSSTLMIDCLTHSDIVKKSLNSDIPEEPFFFHGKHSMSPKTG